MTDSQNCQEWDTHVCTGRQANWVYTMNVIPKDSSVDNQGDNQRPQKEGSSSSKQVSHHIQNILTHPSTTLLSSGLPHTGLHTVEQYDHHCVYVLRLRVRDVVSVVSV